MKRLLIIFAAVGVLSGCVAFDDMYDEHARDECARETTASQRCRCHDRVDQNRREHP